MKYVFDDGMMGAGYDGEKFAAHIRVALDKAHAQDIEVEYSAEPTLKTGLNCYCNVCNLGRSSEDVHPFEASVIDDAFEYAYAMSENDNE